MKSFQKLILWILVLSFYSCSTSRIPLEVQKDFDQQQNTGFDVQLPEEEKHPEDTSRQFQLLNASQGSVAPRDHGVTSYKDFIIQNAKVPVHVYIFDTAPTFDHEGLRDINGSGYVAIPGGDETDIQGHGTHCAGIVAGIHPNGVPIGVAEALRYVSGGSFITLHAVQVLNRNGSGSFSGIKNGINWAIQDAKKYQAQGHRIIFSFSLGASTANDVLGAELLNAERAGILTTASAGNTGREPTGHPGNSKYSVCVSASQKSGNTFTIASFSSRGPKVDITGSGVRVYATYPKSKVSTGYASLSGTSMSNPAVAGVYAILMALYPDATIAEIKAHVAKWSLDLGATGKDNLYGYGMPVLKALLENSITPGDPEPPGPPTPPNPQPEPEPTPGPPDLSKNAEVIYASQTHRVRITYQFPGPDSTFWLEFKVTVQLKSKKRQAEKFLAGEIADYFKNRGIVLDGTKDYATIRGALYYTGYFLDLNMSRSKGYNFEVLKVAQPDGGVIVCDVPNLRTSTSRTLVANYLDSGGVFTTLLSNE